MEIDVAAELQKKGYVLKDGVLTIPSYPIYVGSEDVYLTNDQLKQPAISLIGVCHNPITVHFPVSEYPGLRTLMINNKLEMKTGVPLTFACKNSIDVSDCGSVFWLKRLLGYLETASVEDVATVWR